MFTTVAIITQVVKGATVHKIVDMGAHLTVVGLWAHTRCKTTKSCRISSSFLQYPVVNVKRFWPVHRQIYGYFPTVLPLVPNSTAW